MFLGVVLSHAIQIGTAVGLQAQLCLLCGYSWRVIMAGFIWIASWNWLIARLTGNWYREIEMEH